MDMKNRFAVKLPAVGSEGVAGKPGGVVSPTPPPMVSFTVGEQEVYDYVCGVLRESGTEHLTAGITIAMIVKVYSNWMKAYDRCEAEGRYQETKNKYQTLMPWADDEKHFQMVLGQWLPKACLTIPALARVRKDTGEKSGQDDLFDDLVNHATTSPARSYKQ